jgi:hypothetical protein
MGTNPALARLRREHARSRSQGVAEKRGVVPVYAHSWSGGGKNMVIPSMTGVGPKRMPLRRVGSSNSSSSSSVRGKGSLTSEVLFEEAEEDETPATSVTNSPVVRPIRRPARSVDVDSIDELSEPGSPSTIIDSYFEMDRERELERERKAKGRVGRRGSVRKLKKGRRVSMGKGKAVVVHM